MHGKGKLLHVKVLLVHLKMTLTFEFEYHKIDIQKRKLILNHMIVIIRTTAKKYLNIHKDTEIGHKYGKRLRMHKSYTDNNSISINKKESFFICIIYKWMHFFHTHKKLTTI